MAAVTPLLETAALCKRFGGLHAVVELDFRLQRREIRAVIGPNGAGKTTLAGIISGRLRPTSGRVAFKGRDITGLTAWQRASRGIVYTFQVTSIFANLSCYENVALAAQRRVIGGPLDHLALGERRLAGRVQAALREVGLSGVDDRRAGTLPYGHQRLLEVAMALALRPELLILDEPTQGLADEEVSAFCALTRALASEMAVLLIEHNMSVVLELAGTVTVMDQGRIIAEGTPREIERDPGVQQAYLGA